MTEFLYGATADRQALITKDSELDEANNGTNYGGSAAMTIKGSAGATKLRSIVEITMPSNPRPLADIMISRVVLYLRVVTFGGATVIAVYMGGHSDFVELQVTWDDYATAIAWQAAGGDFDTDTDYAGLGDGIIAKKSPSGLVWVEFDITEMVKSDDVTWEDVVTLFLVAEDETNATQIDFGTRERGAQEPELKIYYDNAAPMPSLIGVKWDAENEKVLLGVEIADDSDFVSLKVRRDTSASVAHGDGSAWRCDYGALEDKTEITDKAQETVRANYDTLAAPSENTVYYLRAFSEDEDNTGAESTPSNEVTFIRPQLSTNGVDNDFMVVNEAGEEGAALDVMEAVYVAVTPKTSVVALERAAAICRIDWGDGGLADFDYVAMNPTVNPGAAASITVTTTKGLKVGGYLCVSQDVGGWKNEVRKITGLTGTVITLGAALTVAFTTGATVATTRLHQYTESGAKSARCRLMNAAGFASIYRAITTAPDLQELNPVAVIDAQKLVVKVGEEINLSGLRSKALNMDLPLVWNNGVGAGKSYWSKTAGAGTATFGDSDGAQTSVSFDAADDYTIQLQVADANANSDTETIEIEAVGETFVVYDSYIVVDNHAATTTGDTVTLGGTEPYVVSGGGVTQYNFDKGADTTQTALNLAAAINAQNAFGITAYQQDNIVILLGPTTPSLATNDAVAFGVQERETVYAEIIKDPMMAVELRPLAGAAGFVRNLHSYGATIYRIRGSVHRGGDRAALELINAGTVDGLIIWADGAVRALYPLSKAITIREAGAGSVPVTVADSTAGWWEWSAMFIHDPDKSWAVFSAESNYVSE